MNNAFTNFTKQGIRNLDRVLPRRSRGKQLEMPEFLCPHRRRDQIINEETGELFCKCCSANLGPAPKSEISTRR